MMGHYEYRGFRGTVEYSAEDACLYGEVAGINDLISYEGESVGELEQSFHDAIDTYLDHCEETETEPQKPLSGRIPLRVDPGLHWEIATLAQVEGKSLNAWIADSLGAWVKELGTFHLTRRKAVPTSRPAVEKFHRKARKRKSDSQENA